MLIPTTTVPVTIIGAFAAMYALGFTINLLTLFGLVLAIGIVVDDAIVIVENSAHHIEQGKTPKAATIQAMSELSGPIIGITLVLTAVFLPASFLAGITGRLYRQFALTIAATAVISAINAMTLKPAQSAAWLRSTKGRRKNVVFREFNAGYARLASGYARACRVAVQHPFWILVIFTGVAIGTAWALITLPTGFLPVEDQGYFIVSAQLPDAASQERTRKVLNRLVQTLSSTPGIENVNAIGGRNVFEGTVTPNAAAIYVTFKDWNQRSAAESQAAILGRLNHEFSRDFPEAIVVAFPPPAIRGLGVSGGFQMEVQEIGTADYNELAQVTGMLVAAGNGQSSLQSLSSPFSATVPQLFLDIDRTKVKSLNLPLSLVFNTLQTYLGSTYVNDFNEFSRTYQVRVQAEAPFRDKASDITQLEMRNLDKKMVPLGTVLKVENRLAPQTIARYNMYPAASITGQAAPGVSSGTALTIMEQMAHEILPPSMSFEWTTMAYEEKAVGSQTYFALGFAVLLVYLVLAAQYESWINPLAVILVVPLALLGTIAAVALRGIDNNIYTQIGMVLVIALASKNAILIVEFARQLHAEGNSIAAAAAQAAELRFRPILMTSMAFILGVLPLVFAEGAGAASRQSLGTAVFGGMITATILSVFFVPAFFVITQTISNRWHRNN